MATQAKSLCFASWNTNGINNTKKSPQKFQDLLCSFDFLQADVVFLQETHVGPQGYKILEKAKKWKVFFTVYNSRSRGVAILIKNKVEFKFKYICHDEDCSGGYIVLFCHLYGELYTLVNVYNHKADRNVLGRLKEYLAETAEGVLVVGGDFNTGIPALRNISQDFTDSLKLKDPWPHFHPEDQGFTRHRNESFSRIDMFFLREEKIGQTTKIEVVNNRYKIQNISDHYPLVLVLSCQRKLETDYPTVASMIKNINEYNTDRRTGKISGAEILRAIKSLPDNVEHKSDTKDVSYYKTNCCALIETLKTEYNDILMKKQVPENFEYFDEKHNFSVKHLIILKILAKRLNAFFPIIEICDILVVVNFREGRQNIKWSFLQRSFKKLNKYYKEKGSTKTPFVPPPDLDILDYFLPKAHSSSSDLRVLDPGNPLTNAILNLALYWLDMKESNIKCPTSVSYCNKTLYIHANENKHKEAIEVIEKFKEYSGAMLTFKSL